MTPNPQDSAVALEVELLSCPFCGDFGAEEVQSGTPNMFGDFKRSVYCNTCFAEGPPAGNSEEAIDHWNTRAPVPAGWISVDERLPVLGASVALLKADGWESTGSDLEMNIRACGYLADAGTFKHWAIRGERATELKYFTHWMPLPAAPNQGENHVG